MKKIIIEYFMWFVLHWKPWFSRGGSLITGSNGGVFGFGHGYGRISSHDSFRINYYEIINKKNNNHVYYIFFIESTLLVCLSFAPLVSTWWTLARWYRVWSVCFW